MQTIEIYKNYGVLGSEKNKRLLIRRRTSTRNMQRQNNCSCAGWVGDISKPGRPDDGHGSMGMGLWD